MWCEKKKIRRGAACRTPLTIHPSVVWYQKGWFSHARSFVCHDIAALSQAVSSSLLSKDHSIMYIYLYNQHGQKCSHPQNQNIEVYEVRKKYVLKLLYRYYIICCCSRFLFYSAVFLLLLYTRNCRIQTGTICYLFRRFSSPPFVSQSIACIVN